MNISYHIGKEIIVNLKNGKQLYGTLDTVSNTCIGLSRVYYSLFGFTPYIGKYMVAVDNISEGHLIFMTNDRTITHKFI